MAVKSFLKYTLGLSSVMYYMAFVIGFSVNFHFCHGELAKVSIAWEDLTCCCENMGMKGCCQDVDANYKVGTDHVVTKSTTEFKMVDAPKQIVVAETAVTLPSVQLDSQSLPEISPPTIPIYLEQHSLIFYA